jgi:hypothetical protein
MELVASEIEGLNAFTQISLSQAMMSSPQALAKQLEHMADTDAKVLPDELVQSDASGKWVRGDEAEKSEESGLVGHKSEMVRCSKSKMKVLVTEAGTSAVTGRACRWSLSRRATAHAGTSSDSGRISLDRFGGWT